VYETVLKITAAIVSEVANASAFGRSSPHPPHRRARAIVRPWLKGQLRSSRPVAVSDGSRDKKMLTSSNSVTRCVRQQGGSRILLGLAFV